jgi:hypothetical protein
MQNPLDQQVGDVAGRTVVADARQLAVWRGPELLKRLPLHGLREAPLPFEWYVAQINRRPGSTPCAGAGRAAPPRDGGALQADAMWRNRQHSRSP